MSVEVPCPCGHLFPVGENFIGGVVNCPKCGHAVDVPGLRDAAWTTLVILGVIVWGAGSAAATLIGGPLTGVVAALAIATVLWLVSRAL